MDDRKERIRRSPNHNGKTFRNLNDVPTMLPHSTMRMLRQQFAGGEQRHPPGPLPLVTSRVPAGAQALNGSPAPNSGLRATWLGHSSLLLELGPIRILSDPVWAERASPVQFAGPKRFHPPPIPLEQLPPPDLVLLSHDHYDHLDSAMIRHLARGKAPFVTALGVGAHLEAWGVAPARIRELDWWEDLELPALGLTIAAVPSQHFSGRGLARNGTLWSSWVVEGHGARLHVGCDSGMFDGFAEIGRRYGPFDLATLEIAQYGETWPYIHMTPEEAIKAALDLRAKALLPVHWGTFCLSFHAWDEPIERLVAGAAGRDLRLVTPRLGQPIEPINFQPDRWWREVKKQAKS